MKDFLAGVKRWYLRRFKGIVEPPAQYGGQGTTWRQHPRSLELFPCTCGQLIRFTEADYVIREQKHAEGCAGVTDRSSGNPAKPFSKLVDLQPCSCPVTDARYVKICSQCHLGHWKVATP